jgi:hypothetical protein
MPPDFNWGNFLVLPSAPSGHTSAQTHLYYQWLYANYLGSLPPERTTDLWTGPAYIFGFLTILAIALYVYARMAHAHRKHGELYGVVSFGGMILERIGTVDIFTYVVSAMMVLWALYFIVSLCLFGMVY